MATQTQEQKDIFEMKDDIKSIRLHLDKIKQRQGDEDTYRIERDRKIDMIYNSLTDNQFNSNQGYITTLRDVREKVLLHDLYWRILFVVVLAGGLLAGAIKYLIPK
jgi:hypothetical protein